MKKIKASNADLYILVDSEDYPFLSRFSWYISSHGYATMTMKSAFVPMHRFLVTLDSRKGIVDHIDGNKLNNQKANLRLTNHKQNAHNIKKKSNLGLRGVSVEGNKFKASIKLHGKAKHIGSFADPFEAAAAYDKVALEHYGPDALTNYKIIKKYFDKE